MKFYKKKLKFFLVPFFLIVIWSIAGLVIGKVIVKLFSPRIEHIFIDRELSETLQLNSLLKVFGTDNIKYVSEKDIKIIGLVAGSNSGAILVSINNGPVRTLKAGEISEDGWIFKGVLTDEAIFLFKTQIVKVPFLRKKNNTLNSAPKKIKKSDEINNLI
jgi:hypothetical protein